MYGRRCEITGNIKHTVFHKILTICIFFAITFRSVEQYTKYVIYSLFDNYYGFQYIPNPG